MTLSYSGELEPYYEKQRYRFKMARAGERNKVLLDKKGYDPNLIEDPARGVLEGIKRQEWEFSQYTGRGDARKDG